MEKTEVKDFGLLVTSNASKSHICFGYGIQKSACGLEHKISDTVHPHSDIRWYMSAAQFNTWVNVSRLEVDSARLCKKCLSLQHIIDLMVWCHQNPMDCNMFEKKCDLLRCREKGCLWTKEEAEKKNSKSRDAL